MPDLVVRFVDEAIVKALRERAGAHGRSAEAEHRKILEEALLFPGKYRAQAKPQTVVGCSDLDFEKITPPATSKPAAAPAESDYDDLLK